MTSAAPPLTVGVPVFNGERYLERALRSLREQEWTDFRVLIADNASSDSTEEIGREFARTDERFAYHRQPENIGGARNCNYVLDSAASPWFKWAFYDDVCQPALFRRSFEVLAVAPSDTVLAYPRVTLIDENEQVIGAHSDADLDMTSDDPSARLKVLLTRVVGQTQFGIVDTRVARAAGGMSLSPGGEMVYPTGLALRGKLALVPAGFLSIRVHASRHGGDRSSELSWIDPNRPRVLFPYSRSSWLLLRQVAAAPLSSRDRARCVGAVLRWWTRPGWRTIVGDLIRAPYDLGLRRRRR